MKCVGIVIAVVSMLFVALPAQADLVTAGEQLINNGGFESPGVGRSDAHRLVAYQQFVPVLCQFRA